MSLNKIHFQNFQHYISRYKEIETIARALGKEPRVIVDIFFKAGSEALARSGEIISQEIKTKIDEIIEDINKLARGE